MLWLGGVTWNVPARGENYFLIPSVSESVEPRGSSLYEASCHVQQKMTHENTEQTISYRLVCISLSPDEVSRYGGVLNEDGA